MGWGPCRNPRCQAAWGAPGPRSWVSYGVSARDGEGRPAAWSGAWVCDVCYQPIIEIQSKMVRPAAEVEVGEGPQLGGGPLDRLVEDLRRLGLWPAATDPPLEPEDEVVGTCGRCAKERPLHRGVDAGGAPMWVCETCGAGGGAERPA